MVVEALELAVVQAVSELLVNEEREASRASRESIREDGSIVLLRRLEENLVFLVRFRWDLGVKRRDGGSENQLSDDCWQTSPEFFPLSCLRWTVSCGLPPAGRGVHELIDCSSSCWLPSSGGWSSCRQEGVGAGVDRRWQTAFDTRELVDDSQVSADLHRIRVNVGGGLLCTLQERPDELEDG